ncbi:MAG TPA: MG2 domain-containing protein, partial [Gemmataceae bacterium]|nr:MG2 domain-containing protein [Gemmataceae bacterium]
MRGKRKAGALGIVVLLVAGAWFWAANKAREQPRDRALKAYKDGNYKDAYEILSKLALDPKADPIQVGKDLDFALDCQRQLDNLDEIDDFREAVIAAHAKNWRLLETAALSYADDDVRQGDHYGDIVAGKFYRGPKRGEGRWVNTFKRDRTRALQLMQQALPLAEKEGDKKAVAEFHLKFARLLLDGAGWHQPWQLQSLTDLSTLPDYEEDDLDDLGQSSRGAPVDENNNPVYHHKPRSYADARSDGERWRWMLARAAELDPNRASEVDMIFANFLHSQFGVASLAEVGFNSRTEEDDRKNDRGTFALHTLKDDETLARLATGIKRFKVPDEFNFFKVCERVARRGKSEYGAQARDLIASEYEDRRQYPRAALAWKRGIEEYGPGEDARRQKRLDQIVGNWGRFEPLTAQPAGTRATVDFRFRNGKKVSFEAYAIKVPQLLADAKAYLKSNPKTNTGQLDGPKINIGSIGYYLVERDGQRYIGDKVASWDQKLKPRPEHVDDRITVTTPLLKPGAYLLRAKMENGNLSRIIIWLNDTIIVKKQLEGQVLYYVADAITGQPVARANVEFFGYRSTSTRENGWRLDTLNFSESTDADGQILLGENKLPQDYSWVVIARKAKDGQGGADRLAHLGFRHVWDSAGHDPEYNAIKVFTITDRPVYRPQHTVQFKAWIRHAKYDQADTSDFAGKTFTVRIHNPKDEKVYEKNLTADAYGGLAGEFPVPSGAALGTYELSVHQGKRFLERSHFRVEEYKKPEFEVIVEAPKEPVQLGETINARVKAKYYFGAPVTSARVKYKVLRNKHEA